VGEGAVHVAGEDLEAVEDALDAVLPAPAAEALDLVLEEVVLFEEGVELGALGGRRGGR
jgi:hypothetical protein